MNKLEILQGLKNKTVSINFNGHFNVNFVGQDQLSSRFIKDFEEDVNHEVSYMNGKGDDKWSNRDGEDMKKVNSDMREFYRRKLYCDYDLEWNFWDWKGRDCPNCGERMFFYMDNEKKQVFTSCTYKSEELKNEKICEFSDPKPYKGKIFLSEAVVANYFKKDYGAIREIEDYYSRYNINSLAGRVRTADWMLENQKRAYGQMGNMSVAVYLNKDRNHILIANSWIGDLESYDYSGEAIEKAKNILDNYDYLGRISLEVWRYEVADFSNTGLEKKEIKEYQKKKKNDYYQDNIIFNVVPGEYEFTHYYDIQENESDIIYGEFKLIS